MPEHWETVSVSSRKGGSKQKDIESSAGSSPGNKSKRASNVSAAAQRTPSGFFSVLEDANLPDESNVEASTEIVPPTYSRKAPAPFVEQGKKSNSPQRSPAAKASPTPQRAAHAASKETVYGLKDLAKLDANDLRGFTVHASDPLRALADAVDAQVKQIGSVSMPLFASKSFTLEDWEDSGPLTETPQAVIDEISRVLDLVDVRKGYLSLAKHLVEAEKKGTASGKAHSKDTIGSAIVLEIVARDHPEIIFQGDHTGTAPIDDLMEMYKSSFGQNPAVAHTILWLCAQHKQANSSHVHASGLSTWLKHILPMCSVSSSTAASTQAVAQEYLRLLLKSMRTLRTSAVRSTVLKTENVLALLDAVRTSDSASTSVKKHSEKFSAILHESYTTVKELAFSTHTRKKHPAILLEAPEESFRIILSALHAETDIKQRHELLDMLSALVTSKHSARSQSVVVTNQRNVIQSPVLRAWLGLYEDHIIASRLLVRRLVDDAHRGRKLKKPARLEMLRAVKNMRSQNQKLFRRIEERHRKNSAAYKPTQAQAKPQFAKDDVNATEHELQIYQKALTSQSSTYRSTIMRLFAWLFVAYVLWYAVSEVMCDPESKLPCPTKHPKFKKFRTKVWAKNLKKVEPYYRSAQASVLPAYRKAEAKVLPVLVQTRAAFEPITHPLGHQWDRFTETKQYRTLDDIATNYVVHWVTRVRTEFHDFIALAVNAVVPAGQKAVGVVTATGKTYGPIVRGHVANTAITIRGYAKAVVDRVIFEWFQSAERLGLLDLIMQVLDHPYAQWMKPAYEALKESTVQYLDGVDFLWRILENRVDKREVKALYEGVKESIAIVTERIRHFKQD
ncbi:hypothetical protein HKX48_004908 [Thoreauomyces humboldtii]|nr:hypothetical protein HKX48_004908 [Thoreauomyces humboldtii]